MNINFKGLLVKILIVFITAIIVYSVFWFFKLGQVEKQINRLVGEHSSKISVSDISTSGFPLSQKITISNLRFTLPTAALDKNQVLVQSLEATAGIFDAEYQVKIIGAVSITNQENKTANLQFNGAPQISIMLGNGSVEKLTYRDSGYKIIDAEQKILFSSSSANLEIKSTIDENQQTIFDISASVSGMEGFGVEEIYKNTFEKRIIDALKTGELAIGAPANPVDVTTAEIPTADMAMQNNVAATPVAATPATPANNVDNVKNSTVTTNVAVANAAINNTTNQTAPNNPASTVDNSVNQQKDLPAVSTENTTIANIQDSVQEQINAAVESAPAMPVKNNLALSIQYILTPNQAEQKGPIDLTKMQESQMQYSKTIKVNNLHLGNDSYNITLNGDVKIFSDDTMPSGSIAVQLTKFDNVLKQSITTLREISKNNKEQNQSDVVNLSQDGQAANSNNGADLYAALLERIANNLDNVAKELATKNAATKDDLAQFEIKREKNLEFLVNETPFREILGKF